MSSDGTAYLRQVVDEVDERAELSAHAGPPAVPTSVS
jgi:hypothetical protein